MGLFYTSITLRGIPRDDLLDFGNNVLVPGELGPEIGGWSCIRADILEVTSGGDAEGVARELSRFPGSQVVLAMSFDSDVLSFDLFESGGLVGDYNSWPGAFAEELTDEGFDPELNGLGAFLALNPGITTAALEKVFLGSGDYRPSEEIHAELVAILGLPRYSVGDGLGEAEALSPEGWTAFQRKG